MMKRSTAAVLAVIGVVLGACATATEPPPGESSAASKACDDKCDCVSCSDTQLDTCKDDMDAIEELAEDRGCEDHLDDYASCMDDDAECVDGFFDDTSCVLQSNALTLCLGNVGSCAYQNDGKCDEPEGSGVCAEGTDAADCSTGVCGTVFNGVCDEPQGTALCPAGSDTADCALTTLCEYQGDGICDEPEGSGLCDEGTDPSDCSITGTCSYTNDGVCDEPEGTGWCDEGTDVIDCGSTGTCSSCYEYAFTEATEPLCAGSQSLYDGLFDCICFSGCASECSGACSGGSLDTYCQSCVDSACTYQIEACYNDI